MPLLTGNDFLEAGWQPGPDVGRALRVAAEYEAKGIADRAYLLKLVAKKVPRAAPKASLRPAPAPLGEAIDATGDAEAANLANVRRHMHALLRVPVIERGAILPDACPAGAALGTIPVGGAIAVRNAILPAAHSADICCSLYATFFRSGKDVGALLDDLMASTRFGAGGRRPDDLVSHPVTDEAVWGNPFLSGLQEAARVHLADQGDGNHFAFLGAVEFGPEALARLEADGKADLAAGLRGASVSGDRFSGLALVTHHGSRGLGAKVYARGQKAAEKQTTRAAEGIPTHAAWLDASSPEGEDYWEALQYVSRWTLANHQCIHRRFLERSGASPAGACGNEHNFVWRRGDLFLHGKGATPAWNGPDGHPSLGLIPLHMAAPILLVLGRDNPDYLSFCPHGAGRNVSRTATLKPFRREDGSLDERRVAAEIARTTSGLDIRWWHGRPDLSETPVGYKDADQVKAQIARFGLADVVAEIRPLGCVMAGDAGPAPWRNRRDQLTPKQIRQIGHRAERRKTRQRLGHASEAEEED
jgi:hypothetical protein